MPFARAVADKIEAMKQSRKGQPELPESVPSAFESLTQLDWHESADWEFAELGEFYSYLRGCVHLKIPDVWKPLFPKKLPGDAVGRGS